MMRLLLCCLLLFSSGQAGNIFPVPPSFGDVAVMEENNLVVINLAPEAQGQGNKKALHYFCSLRLEDIDSISEVLSVQLGYGSHGCDFKKVPSSDHLDDSAMRGISCDSCTGSESHVLRCCNMNLSDCDWVLALSNPCLDSKRDVHSQDQSAYPGEVLLFPPVTSLSDSSPTSYSMGLVAVKKETSGSPTWKFVTKDTPTVSMTLVSTFCRQMGFTHVDPGFVTTLGVARDLFNYNFSFWENEVLRPRHRTSEITCPESECCLHCCSNQTQGYAIDEEDNDDDILVIRCSYYLDAGDTPSGGNVVKCQVKDNGDELKSSCSTSSKLTFWLTIGSLTILVCILFICNILLSVKCILRCITGRNGGRRAGYENLEPEGCWRWRLGRRGNPQPANGDPPPDAHN